MWTAEGSKAGFIATEDSLSTQLDVRRTGGHQGWATWFLADWAPIATDHEWLLPAIGGGQGMRSAPLGRWRDRQLAAAVLERRMALNHRWSAVVFAESAWADGLHAGGGAGLRVHLPPAGQNTTRLDFGAGDGGFAVTVGWGEAF